MTRKISRKLAKKSLLAARRIGARVPVIRSAGLKARDVLFPGMVSVPAETYDLQSYYPSIQDYVKQQKTAFKKQPLISIVMPTYNTPVEFLRECIDSVIYQSYSNWELCIADDASPDKTVVEVIKEYVRLDSRVRLVERKTNGHISEATNSAIDIAKGEYISLLDHDDVLWPNALFEVVKAINEYPNADLIYTDEDKIDTSGKVHSYPFLKPDFSPEFLESCNYITHFSTVRATFMNEIGGLRKGYEGAQDWDLFIRIAEKTNRVVHIPKMLYSWRIHETSTAANTDAKPYVYESQKKLLSDHLDRTNTPGEIETGIITQHRTIKYSVNQKDMISIFVTVSDVTNTKKLTKSLIDSIPGLPFEIIYLHSKALFSDEDQRQIAPILGAIPAKHLVFDPATKSRILYEMAIKQALGSYLFFIEDTTEVVTKDWAKIIVGDCQRERIGLMAPIILNDDRQTIASAGVGIGYGEEGLIDMLAGQPFDDPHYARGLYAKSRRNVSAMSSVAYAVKKDALRDISRSKNIGNSVVDLALAMIEDGYRHVYTPYLRVVSHGELPKNTTTQSISGYQDKYLNPNFNHANQRMEVQVR